MDEHSLGWPNSLSKLQEMHPHLILSNAQHGQISICLSAMMNGSPFISRTALTSYQSLPSRVSRGNSCTEFELQWNRSSLRRMPARKHYSLCSCSPHSQDFSLRIASKMKSIKTRTSTVTRAHTCQMLLHESLWRLR